MKQSERLRRLEALLTAPEEPGTLVELLSRVRAGLPVSGPLAGLLLRFGCEHPAAAAEGHAR